jgi:hypothetical protein
MALGGALTGGYAQQAASQATAQVAAQAAAQSLRPASTQAGIYCGFASKERRTEFYQNFLNNYIRKELALPLADSTEDDWSDPFWGMELLQYRTPYTQDRISKVWEHMEERSPRFRQAFLELIYTNYPGLFRAQVAQLLRSTPDVRLFALCAEYLMKDPGDTADRRLIRQEIALRMDTSMDATIDLLRRHLNHEGVPTLTPPMDDLFSPSFLPGCILVYSIQRSNRDYPGLLIIRQGDGRFLKNPDSTYFAVPQLARSITGLPDYLHDGNTPQGIYLMNGIGRSQSRFLGPTPDIQLQMPYETPPARFLKDESITDTAWSEDLYKRLLPPDWAADFAIYGSFYAGQVGRREVIAHGTTIDPNYYKGSVWFPQTPSLGCLCASELWDDHGKRIFSDQQKIIDALAQTDGNDGYLVVVDLDDRAAPVRLNDVYGAMQAAAVNH